MRFVRMWRAGNHTNLDDQELHRRAAHLAARLPVLYIIFAVTAGLIVYAFYGQGSIIQTVIAPSIYVTICLARARHWRKKAVFAREREKLRKDISRLQFVGPAIIVFAITWIVSLYPGATDFQQGVVHYVVAVMITSGILTLIDTPRTAILGGLAAASPFCAVLLIYGDAGQMMMALCQIMVTGLLAFVAVQYYEDLGQLLSSSRELRERQARIEKNAAELEILSSTDPLTGIFNRRAIFAIAEQEINDLASAAPWLALLDLDEFKQINDTNGHLVGDHILQTVAQRLNEEPSIIHCGRIGGDEFAFLLSGDTTEEEALDIANRLACAIAEPIEINDIQVMPRVSIGLRKTERMTLSECLERADFALFKAKGTNSSVALFDKEQEQELVLRNRVAADFKKADLNQELEINFQPIVDFDTRHILSVEALARWKRNATSVVMPDVFIDLAEAAGKIGEITDIMIKKAIGFAATWPEDISVQINLSPQDLMREGLAAYIRTALDEANFPAERVIFEVTETTLITKPAQALSSIVSIRELGCKVALDDFGTGYSSLAYLDRFPFDQIKLDREFARKLEDGKTAAAIASTVYTLCQKLNLEFTVEGIESYEQALVARNLGIRRMQGFYFARPIKHEDLHDLMNSTESQEELEASRSTGLATYSS